MQATADRKSNRDKAYVYHLTHVSNLDSIAEHGLLARALLRERGIAFTDVADRAILDGRSDHLLDYWVPFHFIHQSPFDCAVVAAAQDKRFVLFAVSRGLARQEDWQIVPRHPLANGSDPEVLPWDEGIERIEWAQMDKFPRQYDTDHHCKLVCMAEALAPREVPLSWVAAVYAPNQSLADLAKDSLSPFQRGVRFNTSPLMFPTACR